VPGLNDWNQVGYGGPSPPIGTHHYFFKLYALDTSSILLEEQQANKATVVHAMQGHVLGQAELMGTYKTKGENIKKQKAGRLLDRL
jgi:Raf kinase inhibitor-like YbhB/YbcL family protein